MSLWTTVLSDMKKDDFPSHQDIKKAIQRIKEKKFDINKPVPEIERLAEMFKPRYK